MKRKQTLKALCDDMRAVSDAIWAKNGLTNDEADKIIKSAKVVKGLYDDYRKHKITCGDNDKMDFYYSD